jgi:hypothetical protein
MSNLDNSRRYRDSNSSRKRFSSENKYNFTMNEEPEENKEIIRQSSRSDKSLE